MQSDTNDPAAYIARNWYKSANLIYKGVDFGKCIEYDALQIINRSVLRLRELEEKKQEETKNE